MNDVYQIPVIDPIQKRSQYYNMFNEATKDYTRLTHEHQQASNGLLQTHHNPSCSTLVLRNSLLSNHY